MSRKRGPCLVDPARAARPDGGSRKCRSIEFYRSIVHGRTRDRTNRAVVRSPKRFAFVPLVQRISRFPVIRARRSLIGIS